MQIDIETHVAGLSVRGSMVIFRWKNKPQVEDSYQFVAGDVSWNK